MASGGASGSGRSAGAGNTSKPPSKRCNPCVHWCFTFNNYTEEDVERVGAICSNGAKVKRYMYQEEICPTTGTPHLQGYIHFAKKVRPMAKDLFGWTKNIHWGKTKSVKASEIYCSKEESHVGRHWTNIPKPKKCRPLVKMTYEMLRPWQQQIADWFVEPEDPLFGRTIFWVWEKVGNVGKTVMSKYLVDQTLCTLASGKGADIKYSMAKWLDDHEGCGPDIVVFDIPRCVDHISWNGIECVKNGLLFSGKYESGMARFNCPHVVCFANRPPPREKLSADRWRVFQLEVSTGELVEQTEEESLESYHDGVGPAGVCASL